MTLLERMVTDVSKAVTSFINTSESAQVALIKAAQRGSMYMPQSEDERTAIDHYWSSPQRINDGAEALFTAKVNLPFEEGTSYVINRNVLDYIKLLYIGQHDTKPFLQADFEGHGSAELRELLANTPEGEELELDGALKCEALGRSLRYGNINPVSSEITIYADNPMDGSIIFRVGTAKDKEEPGADA